MNTVLLGTHGPRVSRVGLGCMGMSEFYGLADEAESRATIHAALDAGVNLLDTGDFYGSGHNELLIREALRGRARDSVLLSVKFGALRDPAGNWNGIDTRPAALKNFLVMSLRRLGTEYVDLYRPARLDPQVPIEETVGALGELVRAGYVRHVALSEISADTLRRAHAVHPIADVQLEYSLLSRGIEAKLLPACAELGVSVTAYGVLSRGVLGGHWKPEGSGVPGDRRGFFPRFRKGNVEQNLARVDALRVLAEARGCTVAQLAIAWVLSRGEGIVPLVGARTRARLSEALGALALRLGADDLAALERAVPAGSAAGDRYDAHAMKALDSER